MEITEVPPPQRKFCLLYCQCYNISLLLQQAYCDIINIYEHSIEHNLANGQFFEHCSKA